MSDECKWSHAKDGSHRVFILPGPFSKGVGKKICQDCCRYLGWDDGSTQTAPSAPPSDLPPRAPATDTTKLEREQAYLLVTGTKLPDWEAKFVSDIQKKGVWTEKQRAVFQRIVKKYLKPNETKPAEEPKHDSIPPIDDDFIIPF